MVNSEQGMARVTPREAVRQSRGEMTRQAILEAAERVFAQLGYAAARLEDVALEVGIRRPSIVYYFPGKQELYDEVEAGIFASMRAFVQDRMAQVHDPMTRLLTLIDAWLDFLVARPTAARIILRLAADHEPRGDNPVEFSDPVLRDLEAVILAGVKTGEFMAVPAMHVMNTVTAGPLFYVCNGAQLGAARTYNPADPAELVPFRALLHKLVRSAVTA